MQQTLRAASVASFLIATAAGQTVTFDELATAMVPVSVDAYYRPLGVVFQDAVAIDVSGIGFWTSGPGASTHTSPNIVEVNDEAPFHQTIAMTFVVPGTSHVAVTDFVQFTMYDTEVGTLLATITAFDAAGATLLSQTLLTPAAQYQTITVSAAGIARLVVAGDADGAGLDNVAFHPPLPPFGVFTTFGQACPPGNGAPTLAASTPAIGQPLLLQFGNLPTGTDVVLVVLGFSNTSFLGVPLPLDLGAVGLPGCDLLVAPDLLEIAPAPGGSAGHQVPVPNQTTLIGQVLFTQGLPLAVAPSFAFLATTAGGSCLIGP